MPKILFIVLGTLAAVIIAVLVASFVADYLLDQRVKQEVTELFDKNASNAAGKRVHQEDVQNLPSCVQKWLEYSQVVGKERLRTVRLRQTASMRLGPDRPWLPVDAEQYFAVDEPGFIWNAKIRVAPLIYLTGRDKYLEGRGNMLIKVMSLFTVVNSKGEELNQASLVRYLAEMVWFPAAAVNDYIEWEGIDASSARANINCGGATASGVFTFSEKGEVTNFEAERYMEKNGRYELETWFVDLKDYAEYDGIKIPAQGEVIWKLAEGNFSWYKLRIEELDYNVSEVY